MFEEFLNKRVNIGVPNFLRPTRLFFITGDVLSVSEGYITLKIKDGLRKIPYSDVIQIIISKEGNHGN